MITCTFVGTARYDLDLGERIQAALKLVISKGENIEFFFYRKTEEFYHICLFEVLKAKHLYPRKKITVTLFVKEGDKDTCSPCMRQYELPKCVFDKIIPVRFGRENKASALYPWKIIERNMVRQSDYVIACSYPELHDGEHELFGYSAHQRNVHVINLLNEETSGFIRDCVKGLPAKELAVV